MMMCDRIAIGRESDLICEDEVTVRRDRGGAVGMDVDGSCISEDVDKFVNILHRAEKYFNSNLLELLKEISRQRGDDTEDQEHQRHDEKHLRECDGSQYRVSNEGLSGSYSSEALPRQSQLRKNIGTPLNDEKRTSFTGKSADDGKSGNGKSGNGKRRK
eukprot:Selendium_serpulae@DN1421_c0_g1_i1.p1